MRSIPSNLICVQKSPRSTPGCGLQEATLASMSSRLSGAVLRVPKGFKKVLNSSLLVPKEVEAFCARFMPT